VAKLECEHAQVTKADKKRMDIIHRLPCVACVQNGTDTGMRVEAHHIVDKGYRKHSGGHQATIPLCGWHHRAEPFIDCCAEMEAFHGPSLALNKRAFTARYGTERALLERINAVING
jgi:Recombination enhancement, RecA-dependent nuclease